MAQISQVAGTAFVVAEFRAEENDSINPMYRDPIVPLFLDENSRQVAERIAVGLVPVKEMVKVRTRYFDDMLDRRILSGCRQVVVLGAGLDTRAVRKSAEGVTYFEIDEGAILAFKKACYAANGISANLKFIPGNYVTDGLIGLLEQNGFDFGLPTFLIWEGNTMYLSKQDDHWILRQLVEHLENFHLSFDYMSEAMINKTTGHQDLDALVDKFVAMEAPWVTGFDDVGELASKHKLKVIEDFTIAQLYRDYRRNGEASVRVFGEYFSLCTLATRTRIEGE